MILRCNKCDKTTVRTSGWVGNKCRGDCDGMYVEVPEKFLVCHKCLVFAPEGVLAGERCLQMVMPRYGRERLSCGGTFQSQPWPNCREAIPDGSGRVSLHTCRRKAKYFDAKADEWRCKTHDPAQQELRRRKRGPTQYERECAARKAREEWVEGIVAALKRLSGDGYCSCEAPLQAAHLPDCATQVALRALERPKNG